jgi:hypothetical protein
VTSALAVSWWAIGQIRQSVLDEIVMPDSRAAIGTLLEEAAASFRTYVLIVLAVALLAGLVAFLVAHLDALAAGGRWVQAQVGDEPTPVNGWVTAHYDGLRAMGFVVAALLLLLVGIELVSLLLIGGLLGAYLAALAAVRTDRSMVEPAPTEV